MIVPNYATAHRRDLDTVWVPIDVQRARDYLLMWCCDTDQKRALAWNYLCDGRRPFLQTPTGVFLQRGVL